MRILVLADLHFDIWDRLGRDPLEPLYPQAGSIDAVIVAGDIANDPVRNWPAAIARLARIVPPSKIWLVPGNHDYYGFRLDGDDELRRIAEAAGANLAQKDALILDGIRFLCCTLWSDFALRGNRKADMAVAARALNDYRLIRRSDGAPVRPPDTLAVHRDHQAWLRAELAKAHGGKSIVITHHVPTALVSGKIDAISPAFGSELDALIGNAQPVAWLCGHTHRRLRALIGKTEIRNVSLGYPGEVEDHEHGKILQAGFVDTGFANGRLLPAA